MRIVIAGAGEVGTYLAKMLSHEEQDVILLDTNQHALDNIDSNYNVMTVNGSPTSIDTLRDVGIKDTNLFISVTPYESRNLTACGMAHQLGVGKTVARIDKFEYLLPHNSRLLRNMGVDHLIYPENLGANEIEQSMEHNWARYWGELNDGRLLLIGVKVREGAQIVDCEIKALPVTTHNFHIVAIRHGQETIIPTGSDIIRADDIVYFITTQGHEGEIRDLCGKVERTIKSIIIMGASDIALRFSLQHHDDYNIKIIDDDEDRCQWVAELLPDCQIVHGDARSVDVLVENNIYRYDAFLALTDRSESNILSCLIAKEFNVMRTVADVENLQFISQAEKLGIGTIINKKLLASSRIYKILLDVDTDNAKCLSLANAEVAEITVRKGAKITHGPVRKLHLPYGMTLGAYTRDGKCALVDGNTEIQAGDQVVVFCLTGSLTKIEKLFT